MNALTAIFLIVLIAAGLIWIVSQFNLERRFALGLKVVVLVLAALAIAQYFQLI